jgi:hypothetical protein
MATLPTGYPSIQLSGNLFGPSASEQAASTLLFHRRLCRRLHGLDSSDEFEQNKWGSVPSTKADLCNSGVAAIRIHISRSNHLEKSWDRIMWVASYLLAAVCGPRDSNEFIDITVYIAPNHAARMQSSGYGRPYTAFASHRDKFLDDGSDLFGAGLGRHNLVIEYHGTSETFEKRATLVTW